MAAPWGPIHTVKPSIPKQRLERIQRKPCVSEALSTPKWSHIYSITHILKCHFREEDRGTLKDLAYVWNRLNYLRETFKLAVTKIFVKSLKLSPWLPLVSSRAEARKKDLLLRISVLRQQNSSFITGISNIMYLASTGLWSQEWTCDEARNCLAHHSTPSLRPVIP